MTTLWNTYKTHVHPLAEALSAAQQRGVLIDTDAREKLIDDFNARVEATKQEINSIAGREVNPNSYKQMKELLYDEMRLPVIYKAGRPTTDEDALLRLHKRYPDEPILTAIIKYRKDTKLVATFLKAKLDSDGRMRTSYNASGTKNFRISSSKNLWGSGMNLQNIPVGKRPGVANIRQLFIASPNCSFVKGDLVQAETMVVARILCRFRDYYLWNRYSNELNFDIHKWAASTIFGVSEQSVDKHQRDIGKLANHASNYCAGPKVIQSAALKYGIEGVDYQMAKHIIETRRKALPGLSRWWKHVERTIRKTRALTTCLGRRRLFFGRLDDNTTLRDAVAFEPQSVVGDVCNTIFRRVYAMYAQLPADDLASPLPVLQVHDEVVVECPDDTVESVKQAIVSAAVVPLRLNDDMSPLIIPIKITVGKNWRDCN